MWVRYFLFYMCILLGFVFFSVFGFCVVMCVVMLLIYGSFIVFLIRGWLVKICLIRVEFECGSLRIKIGVLLFEF